MSYYQFMYVGLKHQNISYFCFILCIEPNRKVNGYLKPKISSITFSYDLCQPCDLLLNDL